MIYSSGLITEITFLMCCISQNLDFIYNRTFLMLYLYLQQKRGISCSRSASKKRKLDSDNGRDSSALDMEIDVSNQVTGEHSLETIIDKKGEINEDQLPAESRTVSSPVNVCTKKVCSPADGTPGFHHPLFCRFLFCPGIVGCFNIII